VPRIHVIIPCFNEAPTLSLCIERLMSVEWPDSWQANLIIVDDCSEDATRDIAENLSQQYDCIKAVTHDQNRGKGSAVRTGFTAALQIGGEDDLIVIQDADLEYHPSDLIEAINRFDDCSVDAIVGDRFELWSQPSKMGSLHMLVNRILTTSSNAMTGLSLADMECCYKIIRTNMVREILPDLDEDRFGIEPQMAATLSRKKASVRNMPVRYDPRTAAEGKKIGFTDGVRALYVIIREWFKR
jgi:dolichol-phosphate mannosyltransferase